MECMKRLSRNKTAVICAALLAAAIFSTGIDGGSGTAALNGYGVFIGYVPAENDRVLKTDYAEIVVDAQYFSKEQIEQLKSGGTKVYSYLDVGSLENFRDYYQEYADLTIGDYENWPEEQWVDVSDKTWQKFITGTLAESLSEKGVDGFFVDNFDVYDVYDSEAGVVHKDGVSKEDIYNGLCTILQSLGEYRKPVIVNGGDTYVQKYMEENENVLDLIVGINQECVFSCVTDYNPEIFGKNDAATRDYYKAYLSECREAGLKVYLLEYTRDPDLIKSIEDYCAENGFNYDITDSLELEYDT